MEAAIERGAVRRRWDRLTGSDMPLGLRAAIDPSLSSGQRSAGADFRAAQITGHAVAIGLIGRDGNSCTVGVGGVSFWVFSSPSFVMPSKNGIMEPASLYNVCTTTGVKTTGVMCNFQVDKFV